MAANGAIDSHLHAFPGEREGLAAQGGEKRAGYAGTVEELSAILDRGRIAAAFIMSALPVEIWRRLLKSRGKDGAVVEDGIRSRIERQNDWICEVAAADPRLHAALGADATVDSAWMIRHLRDRVSRHGIRALKVHPALNFVFPDHPGYAPIFELAREAGLVVVSHGGGSGGGLYDSEIDYCAPENFAPVLAAFPEVTFVIAHLGHPYVDSLVELSASFPNLYSDLSFVLGAQLLDQPALKKAVRSIGIERVLFGSDFPYFDPEESLDYLVSSGFSEPELDALTLANARRIFALH
jgi:predicted TIM-barrel fold metal-dependent hydrolase